MYRGRTPFPGGGKASRRTPSKRMSLLIEKTQLGAAAVGLLEVVADRLLDFAEPLARRLLEPLAAALVKLGTPRLRDARVRGLVDERVAEAERLPRPEAARSERTSSLRTSMRSVSNRRAPTRPARATSMAASEK